MDNECLSGFRVLSTTTAMGGFLQGNFFAALPLSNLLVFHVSPNPTELPTPPPASFFCPVTPNLVLGHSPQTHSWFSSAPHLATRPAYLITLSPRSLQSEAWFAGEGRGHIVGAEILSKLAEARHAYNQALGKMTLRPVKSADPAWPLFRRHDVTGRRRRGGCRDGPKMAGRFGSASARRADPHSFPRC